VLIRLCDGRRADELPVPAFSDPKVSLTKIDCLYRPIYRSDTLFSSSDTCYCVISSLEVIFNSLIVNLASLFGLVPVA